MEGIFPNIGKIFTAAALAEEPANLLKTFCAIGVFVIGNDEKLGADIGVRRSMKRSQSCPNPEGYRSNLRLIFQAIDKNDFNQAISIIQQDYVASAEKTIPDLNLRERCDAAVRLLNQNRIEEARTLLEDIDKKVCATIQSRQGTVPHIIRERGK